VIGFVTDDSPQHFASEHHKQVAVYVPMSYQVGGFTLLVPQELIEPIDIPVKDAMRYVLTAGIKRRESS
jgi:uncharacterized membrane protein